MPDPPKKRSSIYELSPALQKFRPALHAPGEVTIDKNNDRIRIELDCGDLQPGRRVWSNVFFMAFGGELAIDAQVFAENLPQPKDFALTISANTAKTRMDVYELQSLPEPQAKED